MIENSKCVIHSTEAASSMLETKSLKLMKGEFHKINCFPLLRIVCINIFLRRTFKSETRINKALG